MNFSNLYTLYPSNKHLEAAIAHYVSLVSDEEAEAAKPDNAVTVADNFRFTRGNYEQLRFGTGILEAAVAVFEAALSDGLKTQDLMAWVELQNSLGNVLAGIGQQRHDEDAYQRAIDVFQNALNEVNQEEHSQTWARTLYNQATASQALGRLSEDIKPLKAAVDGYTLVLQVWSREESPEDWMLTMHQLGATFHSYGMLLKGNRTFQKSVVAYKNALAVLNADDYALALTATHNNRATVLHHLGESEENAERIEEAVRSYEKALTVSMEQQLPVHVSVICRVNKATAQVALAELTKDAALAEEMADEFEVILECFPHALQPLCARHCEAMMSRAKDLQQAFS